MAIVKIQKVKDLRATLLYTLQSSKTSNEHITSFHCSPDMNAFEQMSSQTSLMRSNISRTPDIHSWMIIQSFMPGEVSAEEAHQIGDELAKYYLKEEHQYVLTTHIDKEHYHNHIVFNATNFVTGKQFDSRTKHIIDELRNTNDELSNKYGLSIIKNPKSKGVSQKEYYARKHERSYKAQLERMIDNTIKQSDSWEDFLDAMMNVCEVKHGKHIAFKLENQQRFTRGRTLGLDYSEESIKYRIHHQEFEMVRMPRFKFIDKSQESFQGKGKEGLRSWATSQNINAMAELINTMSKEHLTQDEVIQKVSLLKNTMKETGQEIDALDQTLKDQNNLLIAHNVYKNSYSLITNFKASKNKDTYKKEHYQEFKKYDQAKAILSKYKGVGRFDPDAAAAKIIELQEQRDALYKQYQSMKSEFSKLSTSARTAEELLKTRDKSSSR